MKLPIRSHERGRGVSANIELSQMLVIWRPCAKLGGRHHGSYRCTPCELAHGV